MVAPYSGDIFAIVALSANDNSAIPSPIFIRRKRKRDYGHVLKKIDVEQTYSLT